MADNLEIVAKLKLETEDAEQKLNKMSRKADAGKATLKVPDDTTIELPEKAKESLRGLFSGDKGLKNLASIAKGATGGIRGAAGALAGAAGAATALSLALAVIVLAMKVLQKLFEGTDSMERMSAAMGSLFETAQKAFSPVIALVAEIIIDMIDALKALSPLLDSVVQSLKTSLNQVSMSIKMMKPMFELWGKISQMFSAIGEIFNDLMNGIMVSIFDTVMPIIDSVLKPLMNVLDKLIVFIGKIKDAILDFISKITMGVIKFNKTSVASTTGTKKQEYKSALDSWDTSGKETATEKNARLAAEAAQRAAEAAESMGTESRDILSGFGGFLREVPEKIENVWRGISQVANAVWRNVSSVATNVWSSISSVATNVWSGIKGVATNVWENVGASGVEVWNSIKGTAVGIFDVIKNSGIGIWDAIKGTAVNFWQGLKNHFTLGDTAKGLREGIKKAASSAWEGLKGFFGKLKFWDSGGTLSPKAQIFAMSEKGNPEFLFNAGGHHTVINAGILQDAMYNALVRANEGGNNKLEISIKEGLPAGPRELAQWLLPTLRVMLREG